MWCRNCQQDVAARPNRDSGRPNCPRCEQIVEPSSAAISSSRKSQSIAESHASPIASTAAIEKKLHGQLAKLNVEIEAAKQRLEELELNNWRLDSAHAFATEDQTAEVKETRLYNHPSHVEEASAIASPETNGHQDDAFPTEIRQERMRSVHLAWGTALSCCMLLTIAALGITTGQMMGSLIVLMFMLAAKASALGTWSYIQDRTLANQPNTKDSLEVRAPRSKAQRQKRRESQRARS